jgi:hypothetical protein
MKEMDTGRTENIYTGERRKDGRDVQRENRLGRYAVERMKDKIDAQRENRK